MERLGTVSEEVERIGIMLVHGMGEQRLFEHLSSEVRDLLAALDADPNVLHNVDTGSTRDSAVGAEQEIWRADPGAPVRVDIRYRSVEPILNHRLDQRPSEQVEVGIAIEHTFATHASLEIV